MPGSARRWARPRASRTSSGRSRRKTRSSSPPGRASGARLAGGEATQVHGALVKVLGVGVLLRGPSGVGKSEIALELLTRGHPLVADDVVRIARDVDGALIGSAPDLIRHHLEIRGIGILDVPDLFGGEAVIDEARIELICQLEHWRADAEYERVGLERPTEQIDGVALPVLLLPVRPHMATLVEVAVRDHLRRPASGSAAARLDERLAGGGRAR